MRRIWLTAWAAALLLAGCGGTAPNTHVTSPQKHHRVVRDKSYVHPVAAAGLPTYTAQVVPLAFPQRPALTSIRMDTPSDGWAILQLLHGTAAAYTSDGGASWHTLLVPTRTAVQVDSPTASTAFVLENGCNQGRCGLTAVEATFNGGRTWQNIFQVTGFYASSISFPSSSTGFIVGHTSGTAAATTEVFSTTDGGLIWSSRATLCPYKGSGLQAISFLNAYQGFLICGGAEGGGLQPKSFYATRDGGRSWTMVSSAQAVNASLGGLPLAGYVHSMFFLSSQTGFIGLDRGGIYMTRDGGATWQAVFGQPLPTAGGQAFSVGFSDPEHGWLLAGDGPPLYTTVDGGLTWQLVYPPLSPSTALSFFSDQLGYAAGWTYDGATVLRTVDGGRTWTATGEAPASLSTLEVLGPSQIMVLGPDAPYVSLDGGRTWQIEPFAHGWYPAALGMSSVDQGWIIGYRPGQGRQLFFTQDLGAKWQALSTPFIPSAVAPLGGQTVLGVGTPKVPSIYLKPNRQGRKPTVLDSALPYLWRSVDGGLHWIPIGLPHWLPGQGAPIGMRVGTDGLVWLWSGQNVWLSLDGGQSFRRIALRAAGVLADVSFVDEMHGWLLTTAGTVYATSDGGLVWQEVASSVSF